MEVFRIAKGNYIDDLSGIGARIYGGRWNIKGVPVINTSKSRSLATLEYLVHVPISFTPVDLKVATITLPDDLSLETILINDLPENWKDYPPPTRLAKLGTDWIISQSSLLLKVPSSVISDEFNILINPNHPDLKHITISQIENFSFDKRLIR